MSQNGPKSFVLYTDIRPVLDLIPPEDGLPLLKAIFDYADGKDIEPFQHIATDRVWEMIRQKLEAGREKAAKRSETNRKNIQKRWDKESNTAVYDCKKSYTNEVHNITEQVQDMNGTITEPLHVPVLNNDNTDSADAVSDSAGGRAADASAAGAAPRPAPVSDLFSIEQLKGCIRKNKIDLTAEGAAAFLDEMHESDWTLYGKPVEKKTITRVLREWAKRHGEYSAEDQEAQGEEARAADRAEKRVRKAEKEREEAEAREKAEAEKKKRQEREAKEKREKEKRERPQRFKDLLPVAKNHCKPDTIPMEIQKLMVRDKIPEYAVMAYVGAQDYFPADMLISEYPEEFYEGFCIGYWDTVRDTIREYAKAAGIEL